MDRNSEETAMTMEKPAHHRVPVVRIENIRVHPNADKLAIVDTLGYQTVVGKDQFKPGDLAYFIFPDSVVPQKDEFSFLWEGRVFEGEVPERYRRVKAKKLRKEWSEGLLMPLEHKSYKDYGDGYNQENAGVWRTKWYVATTEVKEGDDISEILGIYHYEPPEPATLPGDCEKGPSYGRRWPHSAKGWFYFLLRKATFNYFDKYGVTDSGRERGPQNGLPIYDVEAYKNHKNIFQNDEEVVITEKIHGSNFRAIWSDGKLFVGSRKLWKKDKSGCVWRKAARHSPWLEQWCHQNPGYAVYAEVVPTQDNFNYGVKPGDAQIHVFDILTPDGTWVDWKTIKTNPQFTAPYLNWVPILDQRYFQENVVKSLADGPSKVLGANHRREGCVIKPIQERQVKNLGRVILKVVSNEFLTNEK
jgi:RNA ligase